MPLAALGRLAVLQYCLRQSALRETASRMLSGALKACRLLAWCWLAAQPLAAAGEAELERRTMELAQQLRCLVCQNQTLAESHAGLAMDLKREIRGQLATGRSERQVIDFMVERYGDFVLYRPPLKGATLLLWFGPGLLLLGGLGALAARLRRPGPAAPQPDAAALRRAADLLEREGP